MQFIEVVASGIFLKIKVFPNFNFLKWLLYLEKALPWHEKNTHTHRHYYKSFKSVETNMFYNIAKLYLNIYM